MSYSSGPGGHTPPPTWSELFNLVTLIINIYGLGVEISTTKKFTSGRGGVWETTKDRNLIFGMGGDANVKLCIQHFYPRGSAPPRWEICFKKCDGLNAQLHIGISTHAKY
jgi:hypothetical protein